MSSACSSPGSVEDGAEGESGQQGQQQQQGSGSSNQQGQGSNQQGSGSNQGQQQGQGQGSTSRATTTTTTHAHGRTTHSSEKVRYNPMRGARAGSVSSTLTAGASSGVGSPTATGSAPSSPVKGGRKRGGSTASVGSGVGSGREREVVKTKEEDSDDDDLDYAPVSNVKADKREEIRKQRIESEQRRRDELREGYRRLKEALPSSNQKSSKVALLDRAVNHVRYMEMTRQQLQVRLNAAEIEMARLRQVNEALMLGTAEQRAAAAAASAAVQAHVQPQY